MDVVVLTGAEVGADGVNLSAEIHRCSRMREDQMMIDSNTIEEILVVYLS
jgi:hypothetical protein